MSKSQRGFTLSEMLVTVAILGVLVTMAVIYMRPNPKTIDIANRVGDVMREANRRAVALGPVRSDVAVALGSKARTRVIAIGTTQPTFILQRLQEDQLPATTASWIEIVRYTIDKETVGESWGSGVGSHAGLTRSTDWTTFLARCYPDGTCDAKSLFFQAATTGKPSENFARMSIMPLGGAIMTRQDWN